MRIVTAAAIIDEGKLLVARRGKGQSMEGYWELPGGKVEEGESPESCLAREIEEELGISIEVLDEVGRAPIRGNGEEMTLVAFIARIANGLPSLSVHSEVRWIGPDDEKGLQFCAPDVSIVKEVMKLIGKGSRNHRY
ncbi:MAG TPA: (deoxy)nucleoside triphosphate pyrophosphohydrolase [Bacillota bacterium]|nr:(deoxy)nucleoside triphosphate pyrophosphohydrolase [Bacillota bacterium]HOA14969.1 (deoxy)nucleoside triphosphate pyrophosphohydrolase [Bacillota bacterium]HOG53516.1 (deoxy)nucleoside triphosphate pyrophosphohydrolase [Bacillota bacterium]